MTQNDVTVARERQIRTILKREISRLMEDSVAPQDIPDGLQLFDVDEEGSGNLVLDSLDAVELLMAVEQQYGVTVPMDIDFKRLPTVNDIVAYVMRLVEDRADGAP